MRAVATKETTEGRSKVQSAPIRAEKNFFNIKEAATHLLDQRLEILVQLRNTLEEVICQATEHCRTADVSRPLRDPESACM